MFHYQFNRFFIFLNYLILIFLIKRWIRKNNFTNIRIISFLPTPLIQKIIVNLNPDISTMLMIPDEKYIHLNSTVVKEVAELGGDISQYVPKVVHECLNTKFKQ